MKRTAFLFLSLSVIALCSCKKEDNEGGSNIWDISPVVVGISLTDAQGQDLLNPQMPNALDAGKIKAVYKGQEYVCNRDAAKSKAYMPRFYGLKSEKNNVTGTYLLYFGELEGAKSYTNESVTIVWPDGSSDLISFNRDFRWQSNGDPEVKEKWFVNGSKTSDKLIKIIK